MSCGRVTQLERVGAITLPTIESTTSSATIRAKGNNAVIIHLNIDGTGAYTIKIQGSPSFNGNCADMYDHNGNVMSTGSVSYNRCQLFVGIPEYFSLVVTKDSGSAKATISYELLTV